MMHGYLSREYAEALSFLGEPLLLPRSRAFVLQRRIPGTRLKDAMGCYPLMQCGNWAGLSEDLCNLAENTSLVCFSGVTDPLGRYDRQLLQDAFGDVVIPFKQHFVTDLGESPEIFVSSHHRRNARRSLERVAVERVDCPACYLDKWTSLYANLIDRHSIRGPQRFSDESFAKQLEVPGLIAYRAFRNDETLGLLLWLVQEDVAYYHLAAYSDEGYQLRASFAIFWESLHAFRESGFRLLNLGAGAGTRTEGGDGLARFKKGWSTETRTAFFCGRILDHRKYLQLTAEAGQTSSSYFPAYRVGEFG